MPIAKCSSLLIVLAVLLLAADFAAALEIVRDGEPQSVIVIDANPSEDESKFNDSYAAQVLADWIEKISGAQLSIVQEPPANGSAIYIGQAALAQGLKLNDIESPSGEGLRVKVAGDKVMLAGQDGPSTVRAACRLLEKLGCRYLLDSSGNDANPDLGKVIPELKTISVADYEHTEKPRMLSRRFWGSSYSRETLWQIWNGDGGVKMATGHAWAGFVPHSVYFDEHPEYFSLIDGERVPGEWLCTSEQAVRDIFVEKLLAMAEENPRGSFSISPPDNRGYCQCADCKAQDDPTQIVPSSGSVSMTPRFLEFFDHIGQRVYEKAPKVTLNFYAYADYTEPPREKKRIAPNIVVWIAPIRYSRYHHIGNPLSPTRVELADVIDGWSQICDIAYRTYNFNLAESTVPFSKLSTWAHDIPYLYERGCVGINNETFVAWGLMGPHLYQSLRLMYDPTTDSDALMDAYFKDYYGSAAPHMKEYWLTIDHGFQNLESEAGCYFSLHLVYTPEVLSKLRGLLEQAKAATNDTLILERISKDRDGFAMAEDYIAWRALIAEGKMEDAKVITDRMYQRAEDDHWAFHNKTREYIRRFLRPISDAGAKYTTGENQLVKVLPDTWRMTYDPKLDGEGKGFHKPGFDDSAWQEARTYSATLDEQDIEEKTTFMWYRVEFEAPKGVDNPALVFLDLDCVPSGSKIFINGREMTGDQVKIKRRRPSVALPGDALKAGSNVVAVLLDHSRVSENALGGITRPVLLCNVAPGSE